MMGIKFPWAKKPPPQTAKPRAVKRRSHLTASEQASSPAPAARSQVFVSRVPILNRERKAFGYELLFHSSGTADPSAPSSSTTASDYTSARVIADGVVQIGLDTLVSRRKAFVPVSRRLLVGGLPAVLPPRRVVVQLSPDIEPDTEVIEACERLGEAGYAIAVDNFSLEGAARDLIPIANYVKINFDQLPDPARRADVIAAVRNTNTILIGKRIETQEVLETALEEGCSFFQGFFFGQPSTAKASGIPGRQVTILRLLRAMQEPEISVIELESLIKHEPALIYRILRTVNSAGFAQHRTIDSIRQALVLLGRDTVRRWAMLWAVAGLGLDTQSELAMMSTIRARCCETLAVQMSGPGASGEGFLVGMCSLFEAILQQPLEEVLTHLALSEQACAALRGDDTPTRRMLDCVVAYEGGAWEDCFHLARRANIEPEQVSAAYHEALEWARQLDAAA